MAKRIKIDEGLTRLDLVPGLTEKIWSKTYSYEGKPWALPKNMQLLADLIGQEKAQTLYDLADKVSQNIELRNLVAEPLRDINYDRRLAAIKWVIYSWGGITKQGNDDETWPNIFKNYEDAVVTDFVKEQKNNRIASWSKIFAFVDSIKYAIFDARVAMSLNAILEEVGDRNYFYMPSTKIEDLPDLFNGMKKVVRERYKGKHPKYLGYFEYMLLLHSMVDKGLVKDVLDAEMRLFANFDIHANRYAYRHELELPYPDVAFELPTCNLQVSKQQE